ncbi:hypothetical protein TEA_012230 [Camellia sinensis var. sinensis]|uniref:non-specific serine/threonine protein kinase n=1 Tax=Camellia sinensis var. sinensis TaxID=542762 RepID=A0A4V3WMS2_CAMSN|nr:hypothetical protein TEA_012230 [Camellia sinensis var. sinensis]
MKEFVAEIASMGRLRHMNLCYRILKGVASALVYLHEEWEQLVFHRDVKASNVLLDDQLNGRLEDFGLARLYDHGEKPQTTHVVGTIGFLAPELTKTGKATTSTDVFAFGAFLPEVAFGRMPIDLQGLLEEMILVDWLGLLCSYSYLATRPSMKQVMQYLDGDTLFLEIILEGASVDMLVVSFGGFWSGSSSWIRHWHCGFNVGQDDSEVKTVVEEADRGWFNSSVDSLEFRGAGDFGNVYRGVLPSSKEQVAIKKISHDSKQGVKEFVAEISSNGRLRHKNLVQLLGYCKRRGELLLVYDYMPNGSLDKFIFSNEKSTLNWTQRFQILRGIASALQYLHEECEQVVLHRDVKATNVLLDADLNGWLGDFGLARLYDRGANLETTHVVGTFGYLAPELSRTGKATTSTDVFAFGAFMLEVACGRRPIEPQGLPEDMVLVDWVFENWKRGTILSTCDLRLEGEFSEDEMKLILNLGLLCSHSYAAARPSMKQVMRYLDGDALLPEIHLDTIDADLNGRLGDFGLARLYDLGANLETTHVVGTLAILHLSFLEQARQLQALMCLLLVHSCSKWHVEEDMVLVDWVFENWKRGTILSTCDPRLEGEFSEDEMKLILNPGLLCSHSNAAARPSMRQAMRYLDGDALLPEIHLDTTGIGTLSVGNEASAEFVMSFPLSAEVVCSHHV